MSVCMAAEAHGSRQPLLLVPLIIYITIVVFSVCCLTVVKVYRDALTTVSKTTGENV